jgi:hypothetical protein
VFENRMLRRIFGLKGFEVTAGWRNLRSPIICTLHQMLLGWQIKAHVNTIINLWILKKTGKLMISRTSQEDGCLLSCSAV